MAILDRFHCILFPPNSSSLLSLDIEHLWLSVKYNAIREATVQKKQVKKRLQQLRRCGSSPEEVRLLDQKFHLLVCQHSKIMKEARQLTAKASAKQMSKECHRDIHKFARKILDEVNYASIQPSLS